MSSNQNPATDTSSSQSSNVSWGQLETLNGALITELKTALNDFGEGSDFIVGKDPSCSLVYKDERVSTFHCRLFFDNGVVYLEDWSQNGTYVNGRLLGPDTRVNVHDNDRISFVLSVEPEPFEISVRYRRPAQLPAPRRPVRDTQAYLRARRNSGSEQEGGGDGLSSSLHALSLQDGSSASSSSSSAVSATSSSAQVPTKPYKNEQMVLEEALSCPICSEILYRAVTIVPCGHNFCAACLSKWRYSQNSHSLNCPLCQSAKPAQLIYINHTLRTVVQAFLASHAELRRAAEDLRIMDLVSRLKDAALPIAVRPLDPHELKIDSAISDIHANMNNAEIITQVFHRIQEIIQEFRRHKDSKHCLRAVEPMREALLAHPNNQTVWQNGMSAMAFTSACADRSQRQALFNNGLTALIVSAMTRFPDSVIIRWRCCDFIGNIASSVRTAVCDQLVGCDAVRVIVEGLQRLPSEEKVIQAGTFALKVIGKLDDPRIRTQLHVEFKVGDVVSPYFKTWRRNPKIQENITTIIEQQMADYKKRYGVPMERKEGVPPLPSVSASGTPASGGDRDRNSSELRREGSHSSRDRHGSGSAQSSGHPTVAPTPSPSAASGASSANSLLSPRERPHSAHAHHSHHPAHPHSHSHQGHPHSHAHSQAQQQQSQSQSSGRSSLLSPTSGSSQFSLLSPTSGSGATSTSSSVRQSYNPGPSPSHQLQSQHQVQRYSGSSQSGTPQGQSAQTQSSAQQLQSSHSSSALRQRNSFNLQSPTHVQQPVAGSILVSPTHYSQYRPSSNS